MLPSVYNTQNHILQLIFKLLPILANPELLCRDCHRGILSHLEVWFVYGQTFDTPSQSSPGQPYSWPVYGRLQQPLGKGCAPWSFPWNRRRSPLYWILLCEPLECSNHVPHKLSHLLQLENWMTVLSRWKCSRFIQLPVSNVPPTISIYVQILNVPHSLTATLKVWALRHGRVMNKQHRQIIRQISRGFRRRSCTPRISRHYFNPGADL